MLLCVLGLGLAWATPVEVRASGLKPARSVIGLVRGQSGIQTTSCNDAGKGTDAAVDGTWSCDAVDIAELSADILLLTDGALIDGGRAKWSAVASPLVALVKMQGLSVSISTDRALPAARPPAAALPAVPTVVVRILGYQSDGAPIAALSGGGGSSAELACRDDGRFPDRAMNDHQPTCAGAYIGLKADVVLASGDGTRVSFGGAQWSGGAIRYLTLDMATQSLSTRAFDLPFPLAVEESVRPLTSRTGSPVAVPVLVPNARGIPTPTPIPGTSGRTVVPLGAGASNPTAVPLPTGPTLVAVPGGAGASNPTAVPMPTGPNNIPLSSGPTAVPGQAGSLSDPDEPGGLTVAPLGPGIPVVSEVPMPEGGGPEAGGPEAGDVTGGGPRGGPRPHGGSTPASVASPSGPQHHDGGQPHPAGPGGNDPGNGQSKIWSVGPWLLAIFGLIGGVALLRPWLARPAGISPNMRRLSPEIPYAFDPGIPPNGTILFTADGVGALGNLLGGVAPTTGVVLVVPEGLSPPASRAGNVWIAADPAWDEVVQCADALRRAGAAAVAVVVVGGDTLTDPGALVPEPFQRLSGALNGWASALLLAPARDAPAGLTAP